MILDTQCVGVKSHRHEWYNSVSMFKVMFEQKMDLERYTSHWYFSNVQERILWFIYVICTIKFLFIRRFKFMKVKERLMVIQMVQTLHTSANILHICVTKMLSEVATKQFLKTSK